MYSRCRFNVYSRLCIADADSMIDKFLADIRLHLFEGMTEKGANAHELFARQGILGGIKVPVIWHIKPPTAPLLHDKADVDLGHLGSSMSGIPKAEMIQDFDNIKWAARYMSCSNELSSECKKYRYNGTCWLERPDGFSPPTPQKAEPGMFRSIPMCIS